MASDITPCRTTLDLENQKFGTNKNGKIIIRVEDEQAICILNDILAEIGGGDTQNFYGEITSVSSSTLSTIITHTVPIDKVFLLQLIEFNGNNIAEYRVDIDSSDVAKKFTWFSGDLFGEFPFKNLKIAAGSVIRLRVIHERPQTGDFSGRILGVEQDA